MDTARASIDIDRRTVVTALGFVIGVNLIGASPAVAFGSDTGWIDEPWFYPPEIAFPIAWTVLFSLLGVALFLVWRRGLDRRPVRIAVGAFAVQFALNLAWTPVFFGLQRPDLGLVVLAALLIAVVGTIAAFDRVDRRAALLLVPYLAWIVFATALNYAIWAA